MEIFGIGPLEFLFVVLIALLILGPKDIVKVGKSLGQGLNKLVKSDTWKTAQLASEKLKTLPNELMREAGIDEMKRSLDAGANQPPNHAGSAIDPRESGTWAAGSADSPNKTVKEPSGDQNRIAPPTPGEERSK